MPYFLGVDGGNTKTIALVARGDGTILGAGRTGCGDIYGVPPDEAVSEIVAAVETALAQAQLARGAIDSACFSLAGADWQSDYDFLTAALIEQGFGRTLRVYNDAIGALRAGSPDGTGVVIACGTGTAVGARNAAGSIWHSSFWQEALCGLEMSQRALRAVYRAELGIDPPTSLRDAILERMGETTVEQMLYRFTARDAQHPSVVEVARLSRVVLAEAAHGDTAARELVKTLGRELANYALAAARKVGIEETPFTLVLNGGVFRHESTVLVDAVLERIHAVAPGVQALVSRHQPAVGALLLAFEAGGLQAGTALLAAVEASLPPAELFRT